MGNMWSQMSRDAWLEAQRKKRKRELDIRSRREWTSLFYFIMLFFIIIIFTLLFLHYCTYTRSISTPPKMILLKRGFSRLV